MHDSKLLKMYSILKPKEKEKFSKWLKVELDSKQSELLALLDCLPQKMTKEKAWSEMFPNEKFDDGKFRTRTKRLVKHIEKFLAFIHLRNNPHELNLALLSELSTRKVPELYKQELDKADNRLETGKVRDEKFYHIRYQLNVKQQEHANHHNPKAATEKTKRVNESFDLYWGLLKLKLGIVNNSYRRRGAIIETEFIEPIFEKISSASEENFQNDGNLFQNNVPIKIYYLTNKLQTEKTDEIADELWELLEKYKDLLSDSSYRIVYSMIINFYAGKANSEEGSNYFKKLSDFYIRGFDEKILYINKYLGFQHLSNFLTLAIKLKKYDETQYYLETYVNKLPPLDREDVMKMGLARISFGKKQYAESKEILTQDNKRIRQEVLRIQAKILVFKCDYELSDGDLTDDDVQKIIRLTKRHEKINKSLKQFLKISFPYFRKLVQAYRTEDFRNLRDELAQIGDILEKKWILEKIDQRLS